MNQPSFFQFQILPSLYDGIWFFLNMLQYLHNPEKVMPQYRKMIYGYNKEKEWKDDEWQEQTAIQTGFYA